MAISAEDRARLVALARAAVAAQVRGRPLPQVQDAAGVLAERRGCFVTLTNRGALRGCIGTFRPDRPLGEMIVQMGAAAARDPRFVYNPITADELDRLRVEVSVLSPLTQTDRPEKLRVGEHGIYVVGPAGAGCFLPEVATQMGWDAEQFLEHCCTSKAGLPSGAWRRPETKVYLFTSEKFAQ
jgi:AmmeMemoRadiSam system protein A